MVVEGYTDVLACHQAGIRDAVAVMGTAITPEQVKLLSAYAEEAVLALDADRAGREAMLRAQGVASGKRLRLRVARMPEGKDPADLLAGGDATAAAAFRDAIEAAEDLPVFHVRTLLDDADLSSPAGRDRALDEVVEVIAVMPDSITREELIREVGEPARRRSGTGRRAGSRGARRDAGRRTAGPASARQRPHRRRAASAERPRAPRAGAAGDVRRLARRRSRVPRAARATSTSPRRPRPRARSWLRDHLEEPTRGLSHDDEELLAYVTRVTMLAEREPATPEAMELSFLELELARIDDQIQAAEGNGGEPPVELQRHRAELTERIARAHS